MLSDKYKFTDLIQKLDKCAIKSDHLCTFNQKQHLIWGSRDINRV